MARQTGRDVVLELMDSVKALQLGFSEHEERLTLLAHRADFMSERLNESGNRMNELSERMNELGERMTELGERMTELADISHEMANGYRWLVGSARRMHDTTERMARILAGHITSNDERLTGLEGRVRKLELAKG